MIEVQPEKASFVRIALSGEQQTYLLQQTGFHSPARSWPRTQFVTMSLLAQRIGYTGIPHGRTATQKILSGRFHRGDLLEIALTPEQQSELRRWRGGICPLSMPTISTRKQWRLRGKRRTGTAWRGGFPYPKVNGGPAAPALAASTVPGGICLASGIVHPRARSVEKAFQTVGFEKGAHKKKANWTAMLFYRK